MNEIERAIRSCKNKIRRYEEKQYRHGMSSEKVNSIYLEHVKIQALRAQQERKDPQPSKAYCVDCSMEYGVPIGNGAVSGGKQKMVEKPLSSWTLAEVKAECKKHAECSNCPFWQSEPYKYLACKLHGKPFIYKLG